MSVGEDKLGETNWSDMENDFIFPQMSVLQLKSF